MKKFFLAFLFLLIIQSCQYNEFSEEGPPFSTMSSADLILLVRENQPLVIDFNQILDLSAPLSLKIKQNPQNGKLTFIEDSGFLVYEPNQSFSGTDSFTYEITYSNGEIVEGEVIVTIYNDNVDFTATNLDSCSLKAVYDYAQIAPNTLLEMSILENDVFCDGKIDISSAFINISTQNGTLNLDAGKASYIPDENFVGTDEFIYTVCTDNEECASAIVRILVKEPVICVSELQEDKYIVELTNQVLDSAVWRWNVFDNDSLCIDQIDWSTFKITEPTSRGEVVANPLGGNIGLVAFFPDYTYQGYDAFTYEICHTSGDCYTANVELSIINTIDFSMILNDDVLFYKQQYDQNLAVLLNDLIDENTVDWASFSITNSPENGVAKIKQNIDGNYIISYNPNVGFTGVEKLSYNLCLLSGECFEADVKIIVQPSDYACPTITPLAKNDTLIFSRGQNATPFLDIPVLNNDDFCFTRVDWESFEIVKAPHFGIVEVNIAEDIRYYFSQDPSDVNITQDEFTYRWSQDGVFFEATVVMRVEDNSPFVCADIVTVDSLASLDFDIRQVIDAEIEDGKLYITIQYIGGCEFDTNLHYLLLEDEKVIKNIPNYELEYFFKDNDKCNYLVHETRCFDLALFRTNPNGGIAIINLKDHGKLTYKY